MDDATGELRYEQLAQVAQKIMPHSQLVRAWRLQGGISAQMTALELKTPDGRTQKMVIRQPGPLSDADEEIAAAEEFKILQCVHKAGVAAPRPFYLDQSCAIISAPYLVMEYIDGQPDYASADQDAFARRIASELAKIHAIDSSRYALAFLPDLREWLTKLIETRRESLDASLQEGQIRGHLENHLLTMPMNPPTLLHGDFWPGNLLWRETELVAVVDWEAAALGDPLADFAISRLDLLWVMGEEGMETFSHHYRALMPDLNYSMLPYWDLYAALRPVFWLTEAAAAWPALGRPDITEASMRAHHRRFVAQALARLPRS